MKTEDRYLKFIRWSEEDALYVGYCPDLFPWGGVCHAATEDEAYRQLGELVREEIAELVLFMCSDACQFMTADTVYVNGGGGWR